MSQVIQVEELVDGQRIRWFNISLLFWSFLAMFGDGYDIAILANAAPELARHWQADPSTFGVMFSASLFGILIGAPLLGYVGDRVGRKTAVIIATLIFSVTTLAVIACTAIEQVTFLRFLTGIGIGGLMPNMIALNSELAPKRFRATLIVLMFTGVTLGGSVPGVVAAWLVPVYGWEVLFIIGGGVPLVIAVFLWIALPESVKFLARHPERRTTLLSIARRMRPDLRIADDAQFALMPSPHASGAGIAQLFSGGLALITPMLWLCFATALMANYFLNNWMPLLFEANGMSARDAALATSAYHVGGTAGGLLISVLLDRFGFGAVALFFGIAGPAIAAIGFPGSTSTVTLLLSLLAGFSVLGAQFGNNAASGLLYPTAFRSSGVGWALGIGRFGSIIGPLVGGVLISMNLPPEKLFLVAATPMIMGVIAAAVLARLCYVRLGGLQLDDTPVTLRGIEGTPEFSESKPARQIV